MENIEQNKTKDTFLNQKKEEINEAGDKMLNWTAWNKFIRWWWFLWAWYYVTFEFIAPLMKSTFLIASWTTIIIFYWLVFLIWFILSQLYNAIMKILLYAFKS